MRIIKFRAWNIPNKTMYYDVQNGVLAENEKGQLVLGVSLGTLCKDDGSIVMQFTGLHDKNGKEIYEGDILKTYPIISSDKIACDSFNVMVKFINSSWIANGILGKRQAEISEVIGNIYVNPELLTD